MLLSDFFFKVIWWATKRKQFCWWRPINAKLRSRVTVAGSSFCFWHSRLWNMLISNFHMGAWKLNANKNGIHNSIVLRCFYRTLLTKHKHYFAFFVVKFEYASAQNWKFITVLTYKLIALYLDRGIYYMKCRKEINLRFNGNKSVR